MVTTQNKGNVKRKCNKCGRVFESKDFENLMKLNPIVMKKRVYCMECLTKFMEKNLK